MMSLFDKLRRQRLQGLRDGFEDMWGVVIHPKTYYELQCECLSELVRTTATEGEMECIFGLRIIPSWRQAAGEFTIVDEHIGRMILEGKMVFRGARGCAR
jgi:hypothetical protein